jgi:hypothetical protein
VRLTRIIFVSTLIVLMLNGGFAYGDLNPGLAFTFETFGGFGGGLALGITGIPLGNLMITDEDYAGGGLVGFTLFYPLGCGLAVYGIGEAVSGDSANDKAALSASLGAAGGVVLTGYLAGGWKGVLIGILAAPVLSSLAYNVARGAEPEDGVEPARVYFVSYGIVF